MLSLPFWDWQLSTNKLKLSSITLTNLDTLWLKLILSPILNLIPTHPLLILLMRTLRLLLTLELIHLLPSGIRSTLTPDIRPTMTTLREWRDSDHTIEFSQIISRDQDPVMTNS